MGTKYISLDNTGLNLNAGSLLQIQYSHPYTGVNRMSCK